MNVELLRKIEAHILAEPKRLHMSSFMMRQSARNVLSSVGGKPVGYPKCGTAACIAGWAVILEDGLPQGYLTGAQIYDRAQELLGLHVGQADRLFYRMSWPDEFYDMGGDDGTQKTAEVAVKRIEHFIKTEGRE
jgi:hypothetical protein